MTVIIYNDCIKLCCPSRCRCWWYLWACAWQNQQNDICAPTEDSHQLGHQPSLFRVFAVCMKNHGSSATHWANCEDSDQAGRMPRLIWVFAGCIWCHASTNVAIDHSWFFTWKSLSGDCRLYLDAIRWQWKPDMVDLTHTKTIANSFCIVPYKK